MRALHPRGKNRFDFDTANLLAMGPEAWVSIEAVYPGPATKVEEIVSPVPVYEVLCQYTNPCCALLDEWAELHESVLGYPPNW
jgi:hypothetical protein